MSISDKVKAALALRGKQNTEAAAILGITPQAFNNKLNRNSFFMADIIKLAEGLNLDIAFNDKDGQRIVFLPSDIEDMKEMENN